MELNMKLNMSSRQIQNNYKHNTNLTRGRKMKYFIILSTLIAANLFADEHRENPETGWSFEQSQLQMFYYITVEIDGEPAEGVEYGTSYCADNVGSCDVVGAFIDRGDGNGEICVGWQYY